MNTSKLTQRLHKYKEKHNIDTIEIGIVENGVITKISTNGNIESNAFQIASITKIFTALIISIAVKEKLLSFNTTIAQIYKQRHSTFGALGNITIHELLTHCSGLPRIPAELMNIMKHDLNNPYNLISKDDVWQYLLSNPTIGVKKYSYSNFGYGLLSIIIEDVYSQSYNTILKSKIFDVLHMDSSSINPQQNNSKLIIQGYNNLNVHTPVWQDNALSGAGAMISTLDDFIKFINAHFVANPLNEILASQFVVQSKQMCLGWHRQGFLGRLSGLGKYMWHNGTVGGYSSYAAINLVKQKGLIILANKGLIIDDLGYLALSYLN
ncbi:MAG: serine hydrolase [Ferruginibacter sp.]|nr:serine hydrolase [Ferruginibacter sp.]